jgi:hypothetical protein
MKMNIKCLLLKVDNVIITEIEEVPSELGEPDCRLINPYQINENSELSLWPEVTDQREMMIHSDSILTIVEPKKEIIEKYLQLTKE